MKREIALWCLGGLLAVGLTACGNEKPVPQPRVNEQAKVTKNETASESEPESKADSAESTKEEIKPGVGKVNPEDNKDVVLTPLPAVDETLLNINKEQNTDVMTANESAGVSVISEAPDTSDTSDNSDNSEE